MSGCRVDFAAEKKAARLAENFEPPFLRPRTASRWRLGAAVGSSSRRHGTFRALWIALLLALFLWTAPGVLPWLLREVRAGQREPVMLAWTFVAARGSAADKTSDTTIAMNPSATLDVGDVIIVFCASDNTATSDTESSEHTVTDSASNKWHKIREHCKGAAGANNGVTGSVWMSKLTAQITTSGTITLTTSASKTAKCIGAMEVSSSAGAWDRIDVQVDAGTDDTPTPASLTIKSAAVLAVGVVFAERPDGDTFTGDADYSNTFSFGTTGGAATTNVCVRAETRIATLTSDTWGATLQAAGDHVGMIVLLREAATKTRTWMVKSSGGHYASLNSYESARQADIAAAQEITRAECWNFNDATATTFDGWTTSTTYWAGFYVPAGERHDGTAGTGYRIEKTSASGAVVLTAENDFRAEGAEVYRQAANKAGFLCYVEGTDMVCNVRWSHLLVHGTSSAAGISHNFFGGPSGTIYVWNTIVYEAEQAAIGLNASGVTLEARNVTAADCGTIGFSEVYVRDTGTFRPKNCIAQNPNVALGGGSEHFSGTFTGAEYNLSGDGTAPGTNSRINKTVTFAAAASKNFKLSSSDTEAKDFGLDLSADAQLPFSDDILGTSRPQGSAWDMGAHEAAAAAVERPRQLMGAGW